MPSNGPPGMAAPDFPAELDSVAGKERRTRSRFWDSFTLVRLILRPKWCASAS